MSRLGVGTRRISRLLDAKQGTRQSYDEDCETTDRDYRQLTRPHFKAKKIREKHFF